MLQKLIMAILLTLLISAIIKADDAGKLRKAAEKCDLPKAHQLLAKGVDVNDADGKGVTALMLAAGKGCAEVVQALLDAGADAAAADNNGSTAAMLAQKNGYADIVTLLNRPKPETTRENVGKIPCSSVKLKSGEKSKQERFFSAPQPRVKEVLIDAMAAAGFAVKKDEGNRLEAILKYPELGGGNKKSKGEKLVFNLETVEQSGSSVVRVTGETKSGGLRLRTYHWTAPALQQAECLLALFDFRTNEELMTENIAETKTEQKIALPDGTPIKLRLRRHFSANEVTEGQRIAFEVIEDVIANDGVVIKKGALGWGQITSAQKSKNFNRKAKLDFTIDYVRAVNGQNIPVRSYRETMGGTSKSKTTATTAANVAASGGIGLLGLALTNGKNVGIRAGTEFIVFSDGN